MEWRIRCPARLMALGPSMAGKSTLLLNLVCSDVWEENFPKVVFTAPLANEDSHYINKLREKCEAGGKELLVLDRLPEIEELKNFAEGGPLLLLVDDVLGYKNPEGLTDLFTLHSHHNNITCCICVQNPFIKTAKLDLVTLSRNVTGRLVLFQLSDWSVYKHLNSKIFPEKKNFLLDCLNTARTRYGLPYVYINTDPFSGLDRRYICYTGLCDEERARFGGSPLFFDLEA